MTENPYQTHDSAEQLETERTVIIDPVTGGSITIGARIERTTTDAEGHERRDVLNAVTASADHAELLFPFKQPLWRCCICGAQPLVKPFFCGAPAIEASTVATTIGCGRPICAADRVIDNDVVLCAECGHVPWWQKFLRWLTDL